MRCPFCNSETKVIDSRYLELENSIRRRRECINCHRRFTTYERISPLKIKVIKKSGKKERFDLNKVTKGLIKATEKRPVTNDQLKKIALSLETHLRLLNKKEITSRYIGAFVLRKLKKLDNLAYVRFMSVYKDLNDLDMLKKEIEKIEKNIKKKNMKN